MKFKKIISVLAVLSLLFSSAGISCFASAKQKDSFYSIVKTTEQVTEETTNTEDTTQPTTEKETEPTEPSDYTEPTTEPVTDDLHQYEDLRKELVKSLEQAKMFNKSLYTEESYKALETEINNSQKIIDNWQKLYAEGQKALSNLQSAVNNLLTYEKLLQGEIEKAEKISPEWYTETSFKALSDAIEKGKNALKNGNITADIATPIIDEIQRAENNLYNIIDYLKFAIAEAKLKYKFEYEESSLEQFKAEIERIEKSITDDITSEDVKKLLEDVSKSYSLLKPVIGDTNVDGEITIDDATALQRYISKLDLKIELGVSDVNYDNKITVRDVTNIQKYVAKLIDEFGKDIHIPDYTTEWNLVLVNYKYPIKEGYVPSMRVVDGRSIFTFDTRAADALEKMLDDCRAEGLDPLICSAYRTQELQEKLFSNKVSYYTNQGYSYDKAVELAKTSVAYPGTSEHQLGLAADIVSLHYQILDEGQLKTAEQQWLMKNCWKYGFILRYPTGKQDITGVIFEPWHYRYVGVEAAKEIMEKGITLEEYLGLV